MAMSQYKILIDYPKCLNYEDINFIELITLISLSSYQLTEKNDKRIAYFLYNILKEEKLKYDNETNSKIPSLIVATCQSLGVLEEYNKVLLLARQGINLCLKAQILNSLPHLFYYKSLSLLNLDKKQEALKEVKNMFMLLEVQNNEEKIQIFDNLVQKQFNISKSDLMKEE